MKRSDLNHLRRLVAWVKCEIGQPPDELVKTMRNLAERGITPELTRTAALSYECDAATKRCRVERIVMPRNEEAC